jgi:GAF domain-containing protein
LASDFAQITLPVCVRPVVDRLVPWEAERRPVVANAPKRDHASDAAETRLNRLVNLILETAVDAIGFDAATLSARQGDAVATIGATDKRLIELDEAQYEAGEGPCMAVLDPHDPIYVEDVSEDDRWQVFRETAEHLGIHSSLSLHLPFEADTMAASLNLYSKRRLDLTDQQVRHAGTYAEQLAAAIISVDAYRSAAKLARDRADAMRSRAVVEQAKGILMADNKISDDAAFERLIQRSEDTHTELRDVAGLLVAERTGPLE